MKKYFLAALVIIGIPILVNFICLSSTPFDVVTDEKGSASVLWVNFFGCYLGGVVTALISMFIFYRTLTKDKYEKEYEIKNQHYDQFCKSLSIVATSLDTERLAYILLSIPGSNNHELTTLLKEISEVECKLKDMYNSFMLIYGNERSESKEKFVKVYCEYSETIRKELDIVFEEISRYKETSKIIRWIKPNINERLYKTISMSAKRLESLGDVTTHVLNAAQEWKKEKYLSKEAAKTKYTDFMIL